MGRVALEVAEVKGIVKVLLAVVGKPRDDVAQQRRQQSGEEIQTYW